MLAVGCGLVVPTASAAPVNACAPATAAVETPAVLPVLDWSENVGYDVEGNLWVSRIYRNEVQRYDRSGTLTGSVPVEFPGAVRLGPDGLLYVVYGDSPTSALRPGGVVRFDPAAVAPTPEVFVSGLSSMPNGAAFDADGDLYIGSMGGLLRVRRDGTLDTEWNARAAVPGANGVVAQGRSLYVTANGADFGQLLRVSIDDPADRSLLARLPSPVASLPNFADDLVIAPDGILSIATLAGQLVRVDPSTGATCTVLTTQPMTALVAVPGAPDQLLASTEGGDVLRITLPH
ncbi:hypothetical protein GCM10023318_01360 [Nocardia callitridis]|uniref:SMP-30/Gluconolactonase/LRE-like region domain-containing protein n=1 Tax=Nocardia callitridis TaxID=648753 RepID=A0ABP9JUF2_9NOCA